MQPIIVISGPTCVGKTALTLRLAHEFSTIILSADSRQVYKKLNIGTAKPSATELGRVPHYLIDYLELHEKISAGSWAEQAEGILSDHFADHTQPPIIAGGTLFYIDALLRGIDQFPEVPPQILQELNDLYQSAGISALQQELQHSDPKYYEQVDTQNQQRLIRALSVIRTTGRSFSSYLHGENNKTLKYRTIYIQLHREREELYNRINSRVDDMIRNGLVHEVQQYYDYRNYQSMQTVGYKEIVDYLDGNTSLETAIHLIKRNTRRYAKRQLTWMRGQDHWHLFHPDQYEEIQAFISNQTKAES